MFALDTVLFPGLTLPLHVFEDRYTAMVRHLLDQSDLSQRRFGIVSIREGYDMGGHAMQSAHRVGCEAVLVEAEGYPDGRFDIEVVGRRRLRLDEMDTTGPFMVGDVVFLDDPAGEGAEAVAVGALQAFEEYRSLLARQRGDDVVIGELPTEPRALSYALAATVLLTGQDRQALLEAPDAETRLRLTTELIHAEMAAIRAIPSLPATEIARSRWSPN